MHPPLISTPAPQTAKSHSLHRPRKAACLGIGVLVGVALLAITPAWAAEPPPAARDIEQQYRRGEPAQALQRLSQALSLHPGDAPLRFLQGVLLADAGQSTEASAAFARMTQEFPDLPEPHNNLAVLQAASGHLDAARQSLETALQLDPAYRAAHQNLGDVYIRLALRAYGSAADPSRPEPALQRKLQLARELARSTTPSR